MQCLRYGRTFVKTSQTNHFNSSYHLATLKTSRQSFGFSYVHWLPMLKYLSSEKNFALFCITNSICSFHYCQYYAKRQLKITKQTNNLGIIQWFVYQLPTVHLKISTVPKVILKKNKVNEIPELSLVNQIFHREITYSMFQE